MAGRSKKTKKNLSVNDSDSDVFVVKEPSLLVRLLFRPVVLLVGCVTVVIVVYGPQVVRWLPNLTHRSEYQLRAEEIRITEPPEWIPKNFVRQIVRDADFPEVLSLLDEKIVEQTAAAFQKHPWVERVISVRKEFGKGLTVALEYRKPVAVVVIEPDRYPIDKNGVLLPLQDIADAAIELPIIRNAQSAPPQQTPGSEWGDRTIEGAARVAEVLGPCWKKLKLESIEIPIATGQGQKAGELLYDLRAVGGSRIVWGRAPGDNHPGELTPEQKIGRLEDYQTRYGAFSETHGPYEIDIRHWQVTTRRALSEQSDTERR